jgi:hypothetical protein
MTVFKIESQRGPITEGQNQLAVDIQDSCGFHSKKLHFGVGVREVRRFFARNPLCWSYSGMIRNSSLVCRGIARYTVTQTE